MECSAGLVFFMQEVMRLKKTSQTTDLVLALFLYDDGIVRKMIERVTVVDEETIRVKFRYSDLEIEQTVR